MHTYGTDRPTNRDAWHLKNKNVDDYLRSVADEVLFAG